MELKRRKEQNFKTKGPRTFMMTVGGMGAGKGYAMSRVFNGEAGDVLGAESDYTTVDPDDVRQGSETFKDILAEANEKNHDLPKDLISNNKLFTCRGGMWHGQNCSWLQVTHTYNYRVLQKLYLDADSGTSIIYDSACTDLAYCEGLLTTAAKIGFEKLVIMWVHVPVNCSHYRAAEVRPAKQGRYTTRKNVFESWDKATKNAPKLFRKVKALTGTGKVKSWVTIKSTGDGSKRDEHDCWEDTKLEVNKGFAKGGRRTSKGQNDDEDQQRRKDADQQRRKEDPQRRTTHNHTHNHTGGKRGSKGHGDNTHNHTHNRPGRKRVSKEVAKRTSKGH
jgi:hypothetical protein